MDLRARDGKRLRERPPPPGKTESHFRSTGEGKGPPPFPFAFFVCQLRIGSDVPAPAGGRKSSPAMCVVADAEGDLAAADGLACGRECLIGIEAKRGDGRKAHDND